MRHGACLLGTLERGGELKSTNGRFKLVHHDDGNVALWRIGKRLASLWHTKTWARATTSLVMQPDGNLVLYGATGPVFATGTWGHPGAYGCLQDDGNFVIYTAEDEPLWSTNTWRWASHAFGE